MQIIRLVSETDFEGWRTAARALLVQGVAPEKIEWRVGVGGDDLFDTPDFVLNAPESLRSGQSQANQFRVSRDFIELCRKAILHSDPSRFGLLYRLLWRLQQVPKLLQISFDPDVAKVQAMVKAVRRDLHKMKAFVRFREVTVTGEPAPAFVAWFEPSHHIIAASSSFFTGRFTNMRWSILTPDICMHWNGETLSYTQGAHKGDAPGEDAGEDLWRTYYRNIFNPARLKVSAMQAEMPKKYWRNLPEAPLIAELIANASQRMDSMIIAQPTEPKRKIVKYVANKESPVLPDAGNATGALCALNNHMLASIDFPLAVHATQAVLGTGAAPASMMLLGEHPDEQEDLGGQPFIGPAGKLLYQALLEAGIQRAELYLTNALKHYKFKLQGTGRVSMLPGENEINLYQPWLQGEIALVQPQLVIALGAVAAYAITGMALEMEANRGKLFQLANGGQVLVTYHPSFILGAKDVATKQLRYEKLVADLQLAAKIATTIS